MRAIESLQKRSDVQEARSAAPRTIVALFALVAGLSIGVVSRAMAPTLTPAEQFQLRNMCSNAAEKAFQAHWSHPSSGVTLLGFTNRYNVKTNRCYLMVTYREGKSTWFDVSDVQTGKTQAHIKVGSSGKPEPSVTH